MTIVWMSLLMLAFNLDRHVISVLTPPTDLVQSVRCSAAGLPHNNWAETAQAMVKGSLPLKLEHEREPFKQRLEFQIPSLEEDASRSWRSLRAAGLLQPSCAFAEDVQRTLDGHSTDTQRTLNGHW